MRPAHLKFMAIAAVAAFTFASCNGGKGGNNDSVSDSKKDGDAQAKTPTQAYVDSMLMVPTMQKKMEDIASMYEPFTIVKDGGKYYLMKVDEIEETIKKIPMDTLLAFNDDIYMYDDYDKFKMPGDLFLDKCYFDKDADQVDVKHIDLKPELKDIKGTAFVQNSTTEHTVKHLVMTVKLYVDADTFCTEKVNIDMDVPPRSVKEVNFNLTTMNEDKLDAKLGDNMFYHYVFKLEDYKFE